MKKGEEGSSGSRLLTLVHCSWWRRPGLKTSVCYPGMRKLLVLEIEERYTVSKLVAGHQGIDKLCFREKGGSYEKRGGKKGGV